MTRIDRKSVKHWMIDREIDSFERLAELADLSPTTLYKTLDGANFKISTADAIAKALGVHPFDILDTNGHPVPHMEAQTVAV